MYCPLVNYRKAESWAEVRPSHNVVTDYGHCRVDIDDYSEYTEGFISCFTILPEFLGQKKSYELMAKADELMKSQGVTYVELEADEGYHELYLKMGYQLSYENNFKYMYKELV